MEFIPTAFNLGGAGTTHSPNSAEEALRRETDSIIRGGTMAFYGNTGVADPILLRESTVIGLDPYDSLLPATRSMIPEEKKEETVDETLVTKANVVKEKPVLNVKGHVRLDLPAPIELID